jgi:hypothetical protein
MVDKLDEYELRDIWDKLWEKFKSNDPNFNYEFFKSKMLTKDDRKTFWDNMHDKINLGDYDTYEKKLTGVLPSTSSASTPPPPPPNIIDYKIKYPAAQNPTKPFNSIPCDEKVYNWDYGCKNNKIGLMNTILFGDEYGKIYGPETLTKLRNIRYLGPQETKITEDIYNKVLKLGEEQGSVKLQETIVKQTVKNILKERLIKK